MNKEQLIEKMVDGVLEGFDFVKVHNVMKQLNWKWITKSEDLEVPSVYRISKEANRLLCEVAAHYPSDEFISYSTGGLMAMLSDGALSLNFVLESSEIFDREVEEQELKPSE